MDIVFSIVIAGVVIGLYEVYRAHKNHVAFKTEATNDLSFLKSRVSYLEQKAFQTWATATSGNSTPPPAS